MPDTICGYLKMTLAVRKEIKECFGEVLDVGSSN